MHMIERKGMKKGSWKYFSEVFRIGKHSTHQSFIDEVKSLAVKIRSLGLFVSYFLPFGVNKYTSFPISGWGSSSTTYMIENYNYGKNGIAEEEW